jgi:hypothetical protein
MNDDKPNQPNLKWFTHSAAFVVLVFLVALAGAIVVAAWKWALG